MPRDEALARSGKMSKALDKSRKQVEEGNNEAAQLKVLPGIISNVVLVIVLVVS